MSEARIKELEDLLAKNPHWKETAQKMANELISLKLKAVNAGINECEALADKHGVDFRLDTAYGMGGTYAGDRGDGKDTWGDDAGWQPSSQSC